MQETCDLSADARFVADIIFHGNAEKCVFIGILHASALSRQQRSHGTGTRDYILWSVH